MNIDGMKFTITATLSQWQPPRSGLPRRPDPEYPGWATSGWSRLWTITAPDGRLEATELACHVARREVPAVRDLHAGFVEWHWRAQMPNSGGLDGHGAGRGTERNLEAAWRAADDWIGSRSGNEYDGAR